MRHLQDIRNLAALVEAEAQGQQVDAAIAIQLATGLASALPNIANSMNLICERMRIYQGQRR